MKKITLVFTIIILFGNSIIFASTIHNETFDSDLGTWTGYSVVGDEEWIWQDTYGEPDPGCAKISGYSSPA